MESYAIDYKILKFKIINLKLDRFTKCIEPVLTRGILVLMINTYAASFFIEIS